MWIAHNFIQSEVNDVRRLEDIGSQWFDELVKKSFFQRAWDNNSYVMHELMHDLAVSVSSNECLYLAEGLVEIPPGVRHLSVDTNNLEVIKRIQNHKNLRSFLYFVRCRVDGMYSAINSLLSNLDSIRVLDLSYMHMEKEIKPPTNIWNLRHLRFLDLSSTGIKVLCDDSSINLYHLQALYIRKCNFNELPRDINKLINLRHLWADEETIAQISGIGQLTNLQELDVFVIRKKKGHRITELENLREVRGTLSIKNIQNIKNKNEAKLANLVNKRHLDCIRIIANHAKRNSNEDMEVLQELQPNKDIKDLRIDSYAGLAFPNYWIIQIGDHFPNLNTLSLVSCVNVKFLPPLGELPSLKHLQIKEFDSVEHIDSHLYGKKQTIFPLLEVLVLVRLSNCEEWTDACDKEFFPRLCKLTIENNRILRKAPLHLFSSTLKELKIHLCESLISLGNSIPIPSSITHLELSSSPGIISLDPLKMPLLEDLNLDHCSELEIKLGDLQYLTHLKRMRILSCPKLLSRYSINVQQKGKGLQVHRDEVLRSLTHIEADGCSLSHDCHLILGSLPSLRVLKLSNTTQFTQDQTSWFQQLTTLQEIHFSNCHFEHLLDSLTLLYSLKKMELTECTKVESLSYGIPPNLQELTLRGCSRDLVQQCKDRKDHYQEFKSTIPVLHTDDTTHSRRGIPSAHDMKQMKIRKPISDAIGCQACSSCGKTFELTDLVLYDYNT